VFARGQTLLVLLALGWTTRAEARPSAQSEDGCDASLAPHVEWAIDHELDLDLPPVLYFDCPLCAADALPAIELRERDTGVVRAGAVEWVRDEHGARVPFVRWIAEQPLEQGDYEADVTLPDGLGALETNPWAIHVEAAAASRPELVIELDEQPQPGWTYVGSTLAEVCGLEPERCADDAFGTRRMARTSLVVFGRPDYEHDGLGRVSGAYVYRVSAYADGEQVIDGEWGNLIVANDSRVTLHLQSERALAARELCVEVQSLRVVDGAVATQPRSCIGSAARSRASEPSPFVALSAAQRAACVAPDAGIGDPWMRAWCDHNFLDCASASFVGAEGCADHRSHCEGYEAPIDSSHGSGTADAGPRGTPPRAVPAGGGCGVVSRSTPEVWMEWAAAAIALGVTARMWRRLRYNRLPHGNSDPDPRVRASADPDRLFDRQQRDRWLRRYAGRSAAQG
jgi:hypothetical protein